MGLTFLLAFYLLLKASAIGDRQPSSIPRDEIRGFRGAAEAAPFQTSLNIEFSAAY
jgi:hypothetical protein